MKKTNGATRQPAAAALPTTGLWNFAQVCTFYNVSERKGAQLRAAGALPDAIVLGPRCLRWVPSEVMAGAAQGLPRAQQLQPEPAQLAAAHQQRTTVSA